MRPVFRIQIFDPDGPARWTVVIAANSVSQAKQAALDGIVRVHGTRYPVKIGSAHQLGRAHLPNRRFIGWSRTDPPSDEYRQFLLESIVPAPS